MRIGIIGLGRLGRSLQALLGANGWDVDARGRHAGWPDAPAVLLTVPDEAIASVAERLPKGPIVLHCSGACGLDVLGPHAERGSFHPLMTFPGPDIALPELSGVTAALAGTESAQRVGRALAAALDMRPLVVPGDRRLYHAAAVMAGNFATVLLADAAEILVASGVSRADAASTLMPLAIASLQNALPDPARALTGPAARGDRAVIASHESALEEADLRRALHIYRVLTQRALEIVEESR